MSSYPAPGHGSWPRPSKQSTSGIRRARVECPACHRLMPANAIGSHRRICGMPKGQELPQGHRRCGVDGCTRILPLYGRVCWLHEDRDGRFAELDAAISRERQ